MAEFPARARTQTQSFPVPDSLIPYDPSLACLCGGVAPALVFGYLESLFLSPQAPEALGKTFRDWYSTFGMRQPQFSKAFRLIGVVHHCSDRYRVVKVRGQEFFCPFTQRDLPYSMEITAPRGLCIIRRNRSAVEKLLGCNPRQPEPTIFTVESGAKSAGRNAAKAFLGLEFSMGAKQSI